MSSDPFVDLAQALDGFCDAFRAGVSAHRVPLDGSPALNEAQGEPYAGEWGSEPSLQIFGTVYMTAWACIDHLASLATILRAGRGVAASFTLARGACEAAATACYLADPAADARERLRRSMNAHLVARCEQITMLGAVRVI